MSERRATVPIDGWAGRYDVPVVIVGETPSRYRVRVEWDGYLPHRRYVRRGDVVLIPKGRVVE